ncbi:MAG: DUF2007 domain-containing protein [Melioribacteraceae bacterium]|nr:DUF2007 domain-containing protein [Melioribacteraceae bacterium]
MICPSCEYEYVDGIKICPDCKTELITVDAFEGNLVNPSDWVILCTCKTDYEAQMLKSNLEGAEIETLILDQKDRNFPTDGDLTVIKVLVRKSDAETAVEITNDISEQSKNLEED